MARKETWIPVKREKAIEFVLTEIEKGNSLRSILSINRDKDLLPSRRVFNKWLLEDKELSTHYAHACEDRQELIFDQIFNISDATSEDVIIDENGKPVTNHNVIQRDRLRIDVRKWALSKMNPKKYGDSQKIEMEVSEVKPLEFRIIDKKK